MKSTAMLVGFVTASLVLSLFSCAPSHQGTFPEAMSYGNTGYRGYNITKAQDDFLTYIRKNPCGSLLFSPGMVLFNITGFVTAATIPNATVYMAVTPTTSFSHCRYVVDHCFPFWRATMRNSTTFSFTHIPPGSYVLFLKRTSFSASQGFPLPHEFNRSGYELDIVFHGGDNSCSMGAFTIERRE